MKPGEREIRRSRCPANGRRLGLQLRTAGLSPEGESVPVKRYLTGDSEDITDDQSSGEENVPRRFLYVGNPKEEELKCNDNANARSVPPR